jgi:hypothetical protein
MNDFFPKSSAQQVPWLTNFRNKIAIHGPVLGFTKEEIADYQAYCDSTIEKILAVEAKKSELKAAVKSKQEAIASKTSKFRTKVAHLKTTPSFEKSIGEDLGVISSNTIMDKAVYKPTITVQLFAGVVRIKFVKKGIDAVNIYHRKKGTSAWQFLSRNSKSPYTDKIVLANPEQPEHWEYRALGIIDDIEIGLPSDIVEIVFAG